MEVSVDAAAAVDDDLLAVVENALLSAAITAGRVPGGSDKTSSGAEVAAKRIWEGDEEEPQSGGGCDFAAAASWGSVEPDTTALSPSERPDG